MDVPIWSKILVYVSLPACLTKLFLSIAGQSNLEPAFILTLKSHLSCPCSTCQDYLKTTINQTRSRSCSQSTFLHSPLTCLAVNIGVRKGNLLKEDTKVIETCVAMKVWRQKGSGNFPLVLKMTLRTEF